MTLREQLEAGQVSTLVYRADSGVSIWYQHRPLPVKMDLPQFLREIAPAQQDKRRCR